MATNPKRPAQNPTPTLPTDAFVQELCGRDARRAAACRRDLEQHIGVLQRAIDTANPQHFAVYADWTAALLAALGEGAQWDLVVGRLPTLIGDGRQPNEAALKVLAEAQTYSTPTFLQADRALLEAGTLDQPQDRMSRTVALGIAVYFVRHPGEAEALTAPRYARCRRDVAANLAAASGPREDFVEYLVWARHLVRWSGLAETQFDAGLDALAVAAKLTAADAAAQLGDSSLRGTVAEMEPREIADLKKQAGFRVALQGVDPRSGLAAFVDEMARLNVAMYYARNPRVSRLHGPVGRASCLRDAVCHWAHIVQSFEANSDSLLRDHFAWTQCVLTEAGVPPGHLEAFLDAALYTVEAVADEALCSDLCAFIRRSIVLETQDMASNIDVQTRNGALAKTYLDHLLKGDRRRASELIVSAVGDGLSIPEVYLEVFQAAMYEVGRLWQLNAISVAHEHFCTAATQLIMSQLYGEIFCSDRKNLSLVATSVTDDMHEIGIRMVCDLFEYDGWDTFYLGANAPIEAIVGSVREHRASVIAISVTLLPHVRRVRQLVEAIRQAPDLQGVKVMVGGLPFNLEPKLAADVGADGFARNAAQAVEVGNELVGRE